MNRKRKEKKREGFRVSGQPSKVAVLSNELMIVTCLLFFAFTLFRGAGGVILFVGILILLL